MRVWRLTREEHRQTALAGIGASRYGGRWNPAGIAVAYASESLELAVLEAYVRLRLERPPLDYCWIEFEVPDDEIGSLDDAPPEWDSPGPYLLEVQGVGARWVEKGESLALRVPAAVLPERRNVLINPSHRRFAEIREIATAPFTWPRRLLAYAESLRT
jgi:RES domain-containing protein